MEKFIYKKSADVTVFSASFTDFIYKKHCHQEYALGVTLRGIQQYNLDGSFHSSYANGVMLFNPEQIHDGKAQDSTGIDYVMLYIEQQLFKELMGSKDLVRFASPIVYDQALKNSILALSQSILHEEADALISERLILLANHFNAVDIFTGCQTDAQLVQKAKEMIHAKMTGVLSLDEICNELAMSKFQFIRMFKANTKISPYQFFIMTKVNRAKRLLEQKQDLYWAVAECGFVDLSHLNKQFKKIYGITAHEYKTYLS